MARFESTALDIPTITQTLVVHGGFTQDQAGAIGELVDQLNNKTRKYYARKFNKQKKVYPSLAHATQKGTPPGEEGVQKAHTMQ